MRSCGILMPIFSLPSKYGIGTLGREAYRFVDFLQKAGQSWWQMLPIGPTGFGDSPYQSFSVFAGNPYFVDLDMLCEEKLLKRNEIEKIDWGRNTDRIDYANLYENRFKLLRLAAKRFFVRPPIEYNVFCGYNAFWLEDYSLFMAIKDSLGGLSFTEWPEPLRFRDGDAISEAKVRFKDDIDFYKMQQFLFHRQWALFKTYANNKGVGIIGDMPIYTAFDSADVWGNPKLFQLDENLLPTKVAGCPPDAFSEDGQLWGNPLYDWKRMADGAYSWWVRRMKHSIKLYDMVRIDHFRAFSAYYSIPYGDENAVNGKWVKGPHKAFFDVLKNQIPNLPVIAEDLGTLDEDVYKLLESTGFPGMKVLQFAFDPDSDSAYLPHNIGKNCVCYTGTHDNDTAIGYLKEGNEREVQYARDYLRIGDSDNFNWCMIKAAMSTAADTVILQMQDFLGLDNEARINTPSTTEGNWQWRIDYSCINDWLAKLIYEATKTYKRLAVGNDDCVTDLKKN